MVSEAPTKDSIRLWKAIGSAKEKRFLRKTLSLNVDLIRFFSILIILLPLSFLPQEGEEIEIIVGSI